MRALFRKNKNDKLCGSPCPKCKGKGVFSGFEDKHKIWRDCAKCSGSGTFVQEEIVREGNETKYSPQYEELMEFSGDWIGTERDPKSSPMLTAKSLKTFKNVSEDDIKEKVDQIMKQNFVHNNGSQFPGWPTPDLVLHRLKEDHKILIKINDLRIYMDEIKKVCCKDFCVKKGVKTTGPLASYFVKCKDKLCGRLVKPLPNAPDRCPLCNAKLKQTADPTAGAVKSKPRTRKSIRPMNESDSICSDLSGECDEVAAPKVGGRERERTNSIFVRS